MGSYPETPINQIQKIAKNNNKINQSKKGRKVKNQKKKIDGKRKPTDPGSQKRQLNLTIVFK